MGAQALRRFGAVDAVASGAVRLNVPIQLDIVVPVLLQSARLTLRVQSPDLTATEFRRRQGRPLRFSDSGSDARVPDLKTWRGGSVAGGQIRNGHTFMFSEPGLYRAIISVHSDDGELVGGRPVQNFAAKEVWFWVTDRGGEFIGNANELFTRDDILASPAVLQQQSSLLICETELECEPDPDDPPPPPQPSVITGRVMYHNSIHGPRPLPFTHVYFFHEHNWSLFNYSTVTNSDGRFTLPCPPASVGSSPQIVLVTDGPDIVVEWANRDLPQYGGGPPRDVAYYKGIGRSTHCGQDLELFSQLSAQTEVYANTAETVRRSRSSFNVARPKTTVKFYAGEVTTHFNTAANNIRFGELEAQGLRGLFVAAHEYGHAAQYTEIGGLNGYPQSCLTHNWEDPLDYRCAWYEGFANYYAAQLWQTALGWQYDYMQQNRYARALPDRTGPRREVPVAALLLDLTDGVGADQVGTFGSEVAFVDNVAYSPSLVVNAVRDCRVNEQRIDGVDYLAHCLEENIERSVCVKNCPPGVQYFYHRWTDSQAMAYFTEFRPTNGASFWWWSRGNFMVQRDGYLPEVRRLWKCNLFKECT